MIAHNCDAILRQDEQLASVRPDFSGPDYRDLAAASYCLHNIYNALKNTFEQISRTFENHIVDLTQWHKELLEKMFHIRPSHFQRFRFHDFPLFPL